MTETRLPAERRREGNIELLRVVCMLLIIIHHIAWHGGALNAPVPANRLLASVIFAGGMTGINCFVMITGYFLTAFSARRFFATLLQTAFFSVGLTLLVWAAGWRMDVTAETVLNAALVISRSPYWFVVMYLGLTAMLPALSPAVKAMSRNAHRWVLLFSTLYLSVVPTLTLRNPSSQYFHQITWFVYLYFLGAYLRKYPGRLSERALPHAAAFVAMIALIVGLGQWGGGQTELFERVGGGQTYFTGKNTVTQLACSVALFRCFAALRIKPSRLLTLLGGASFSVYLIHDHSLLRGMIWGNWFQVWQSCQGDRFWLTVLLAPPVIYLGGTLADLVWKHALERPLTRLLNPAFERLDHWLGR